MLSTPQGRLLMKAARIFALPAGLLSLVIIAGCNGDVLATPEQDAIAPEAPLDYRVKPDGSGADKNGDGITCTKDEDSGVKGPFLVDNDDPEGDEDGCPEGYSAYPA